LIPLSQHACRKPIRKLGRTIRMLLAYLTSEQPELRVAALGLANPEIPTQPVAAAHTLIVIFRFEPKDP